MNWNEIYTYKDGYLYRNGKISGYKDLRGYWRTKYKAKMTFAHIVVWEMHNCMKKPEGMEIDHINGIKHDNRIENLRLVDRFENCKNAAMRKDNSTGFTGVYFMKRLRKDGKQWLVQIQWNNKTHSKAFLTKEEAVAHAKYIYSTKEGFTERHGK
jgi:hypothetical protein